MPVSDYVEELDARSVVRIEREWGSALMHTRQLVGPYASAAEDMASGIFVPGYLLPQEWHDRAVGSGVAAPRLTGVRATHAYRGAQSVIVASYMELLDISGGGDALYVETAPRRYIDTMPDRRIITVGIATGPYVDGVPQIGDYLDGVSGDPLGPVAVQIQRDKHTIPGRWIIRTVWREYAMHKA